MRVVSAWFPIVHWCLVCAASCNDLMIYFRKHRVWVLSTHSNDDDVLDNMETLKQWPPNAPSGIETFDYYWIHDIPVMENLLQFEWWIPSF